MPILIDLLIVGFAVGLALIGWSSGFLAGVTPVFGLVIGITLGHLFAGLVLPDSASSTGAAIVDVALALFAGIAMVIVAQSAANTLRARMRSPLATTIDGAAGAAACVMLAAGVAWMFGLFVTQSPLLGKQTRRDARHSLILTSMNALLPKYETSRILGPLARLDPFPGVSGPDSLAYGAPRARYARDPDVIAAAHRSVVKVLAYGCRTGVAASGWVAADGVVVTNAHVVAGSRATTIIPVDSSSMLAATVVSFNPDDDVAVLRVSGLDRRPLKFAREVKYAEPGAAAGFPLNGPFKLRSVRVGRTGPIAVRNPYGKLVRRQLTGFRGEVLPGNSGGPMIDMAGRVSGTVSSKENFGDGGYAAANEVVRRNLRAAGSTPVSTRGCARRG